MVALDVFRRLSSVSGENTLTESLAVALQASSCFRESFLRRAGVKPNEVTIATRQADVEDRGIPGLSVSSSQDLVFFEIKEDARLTRHQWDRYQRILAQRRGIPHRDLFGIIAPWTPVDRDLRGPGFGTKIWKWSSVYQMASDAMDAERDTVAGFFCREFLFFLGEKGMKPFNGFSEEDLRVARGIPATSERMAEFFSDVISDVKARLKNTGEGTWETY